MTIQRFAAALLCFAAFSLVGLGYACLAALFGGNPATLNLIFGIAIGAGATVVAVNWR